MNKNQSKTNSYDNLSTFFAFFGDVALIVLSCYSLVVNYGDNEGIAIIAALLCLVGIAGLILDFRGVIGHRSTLRPGQFGYEAPPMPERSIGALQLTHTRYPSAAIPGFIQNRGITFYVDIVLTGTVGSKDRYVNVHFRDYYNKDEKYLLDFFEEIKSKSFLFICPNNQGFREVVTPSELTRPTEEIPNYRFSSLEVESQSIGLDAEGVEFQCLKDSVEFKQACS